MTQIEIIQHFGKYQLQLPLREMISNFVTNKYDYAVILSNKNSIEGFFTNQILLDYCYKLGFSQVNALDSLRSFSKTLNKNFSLLSDIPTSLHFFNHKTELYFIRENENIIGLIDNAVFLQYFSKKMQSEKHHFDTVFNAVPSGIMSVNIEGHITMMNPAAEKISGVKRNKAVGKFITDVVPPRGLLRVLQTGKGHVEKYQVGKRWYISNREPIYDGKQLTGAVGIFDDISKMEMLSTELETVKRLAKENETLLANSLDGVAIIDEKGTILQQNTRFHEMNLTILFNKQQHLKLFELLQEALRTNTHHVYEEYIIKINAIYRISFTPIKEEQNEQPSQIFVRIQEITEQKKVTEQLNKLQEMNDYFLQLNPDESFIYSSDEMKALANNIKKIVKVNAPVLLKGDVGSGRSTIARQIILQSGRRNAPFLEIDCRGKSYKELENLLFDLTSNRLLSVLSGGTIYFKNIDFLPLPLQIKLADLLSHPSVSNQLDQNERVIDIRLIASVRKDIHLSGDMPISEQLYYLLNAFTIAVPSLDSRREDVRLIMEHFVDVVNEKYNTETLITENALDFISRKKWKGNLLEIKEILEQMMVMNPNQLIDESCIINFLQESEQKLDKPIIVNQIIPLKQAKEVVEKELIEMMSEQNISYRKMAKILEVNPSTIIRKVQKNKIQPN
ncbi:sigma 54-interacting transcriptional regulator [Rummeliibacillus sp. NPDC094406]|uniref:sigma 54-interacting transcriptional regulator n=1 Tax=Rummeliibacillus sp. NPDC094406 TaxID=3364511 RepID=UPI00382F2451